MESSRQLDGAGLDGYYMRGMAYMQANQLNQAEVEFRDLLAHSYIEPASTELCVAQLQLARVLDRKGDKADAIAAYGKFLSAWKNADIGTPLLKEAQTELKNLEAPGRS